MVLNKETVRVSGGRCLDVMDVTILMGGSLDKVLLLPLVGVDLDEELLLALIGVNLDEVLPLALVGVNLDEELLLTLVIVDVELMEILLHGATRSCTLTAEWSDDEVLLDLRTIVAVLQDDRFLLMEVATPEALSTFW